MSSHETPDETPAAAGDAPDELLTVHVLGLPIAIQTRAQEQTDELTRELTLIGEQLRQQGNTGELPARLVTLIDQLTGRYARFTAEQEKQLADAIAANKDTVDLEYRVPASVGEAAQALGDILDEADDYCRAGKHLLTLSTPAELVTYRRWFLDQFTGQAAGQPPLPWAEYERQHA